MSSIVYLSITQRGLKTIFVFYLFQYFSSMIFKMRSEGKHCMRLCPYRKTKKNRMVTCHVGPSMIILENIIMRSLGYSGVIPLFASSGLRGLVQVMYPQDGALTGLDCNSKH